MVGRLAVLLALLTAAIAIPATATESSWPATVTRLPQSTGSLGGGAGVTDVERHSVPAPAFERRAPSVPRIVRPKARVDAASDGRIVVAAGSAEAAAGAPASAKSAPAPTTPPAPATAPSAPSPPAASIAAGVAAAGASTAEKYCLSVSTAAAEARTAWQKKIIEDADKELDKKVALLEAKISEYKEWLDRRNDFAKKAHETLVKIFAQMKPGAAAVELAVMEEETSAAILIKLNPRQASAILTEMPSERGARLAMVIAGSAKLPDPVEVPSLPEKREASGAPGPEAAAAKPRPVQ
jgi:flagellar motility protein MotE (MotC chaperone)